MFGGVKKLWAETALTSAFEGVIRESSKGNALEAQRWYFKLKKESYKQSIKEGRSSSEIERRALNDLPPDRARLYSIIVDRLSQNDGPFEEVNEFLKTNRPL